MWAVVQRCAWLNAALYLSSICVRGKWTKESPRNLFVVFGDMRVFALGDVGFLLLK